jgi:signal transduction histidine kinase/CheY-like chemotaxis protein
MNVLRLRTIRQKLLAVVVLTTLLALLIALAAIIVYNLRADYRNFSSDMMTEAELLGRMTAPALNFDDKQLAQQNLQLLHIRPFIKAAAIYDAQGNLFAQYRADDEHKPIPAIAQAEAVQIDAERLTLFKPIVNDGSKIGTIYLLANYAWLQLAVDYTGIGLIVMVLAIALALLVSLPLQKSVTGPILTIADVANEVVVMRDYTRRAVKVSDDEVGRLVDAFNDMLTEIERRTLDLENSSHEIAREAAERTSAQREILRLNAQLELRVQERTAQLEAANRELIDAKAAAEQANQAKSAFLSSMSHELRTPLNSILGFAQLCASDTLPVTPEQRKDFIANIVKAGKHLLTLINEVLDLAKVESGTVTLSPETVGIREVLEECESLIESAAQARSISLHFPHDLALHVIADRTRVKQILLNLLSNAIKYNCENGDVTVSCTHEARNVVRIAVHDTGNGLDEIMQRQLFQPFNRLGQENSAQEGTGIGLVVCKRLAEMMGGTIGLRSSIGKGSTFWVDLPHAPAPAESHPKEALARRVGEAAQDGAPATLLYVEDNPANMKLIQKLVGFRHGWTLLCATDADTGIKLAATRQPDAILMDINLPGMSGSEALAALQRDARTAHIPVIALTASAMHEEVRKGKERGFFHYLTKPVQIEEFYSVVSNALLHAREGRMSESVPEKTP